jgi:dTDP-4-dehydrorhamnose 3,5-epimerase
VPPLCAHGYQTLVDDSEALYSVGGFYTPAAEHGIRFDDPAFNITWPHEVTVVSPKDREWPLYTLEGGN